MIIYVYILVGGFNPPLWKMMEFVSWDDELPNIWETKIHVPNHQPVIYDVKPITYAMMILQLQLSMSYDQ